MTIIKDTLTNTDGQEIAMYIEVDNVRQAPATRSADPYGNTRGVPQQAQDLFTKAMGLIQLCAEQVSTSVANITEKARPHSFEVQFSVKIDAEVGAVLAKSSSEAQLQVTLMWGEHTTK
ncbi:hypothetical protein KDA_65890 [Dictyobacter alpinus]|uniref:Trypsin-co-occurring domain-containing protein n=1 Tax=Dictyobacter alpinus TaxID=2014873 RepID=A0A402BIB0_9CHLR|nr:CU044_2847 family protein [Dictyobacter alpinus]GCE31105.1 hypothetical protein KDA_65890 [Dictyobacter alpinus]